MPLTASFSMSQSALAPNIVVATDSSTGSDVAVTQRRIFVVDTESEYYVPSGTTTDYSQWAYADSTISLNILTTDIAASVTVQWLNSSNVVLYTVTQEYCFAEYNKQFFYYLVQQQGLVPGVVQDSNYYSNMATLWANIKGAEVAVETGDDIAASQNCLNRATEMRNNENYYF